jgi:NADPH-dependent glutamate synthase beta subunit-like oxidoreductase
MKPLFGEKPSPCRNNCPGSVDIPGFIDRIQTGDLEGAWQKILENNPIPRITGRVCFHPCEEACNRKDYDQAVAIHSLERFVGDQAFENGFMPFAETSRNNKKIAVVGTGPAGIGCAFYLLKNGYRVSLFEAMPEIGGLLRYGIPEYRLPNKILSQELETLLGSGAEIHKGIRVGSDLSWAEIATDYQGVFMGLGAGKPIALDIPGESEGGGGIIDGLTFLRDGYEKPPFEPGQTVLIIGGGNTAVDVARSVLRLKGEPLVLYRRTREEMPAFEDEIREAVEEGIEIRFLTSPRAIVREGDAITGLDCIRNRIIEAGEDGRRRFAPIEDSGFFIRGDAVIAALGQQVDPADIPADVVVADDAVVVADDGSCGRAGFYAGGDMTDLPRSVIHALASGKRAAEAVDSHLRRVDGSDSEGLSKDGVSEGAEPSPVMLEDINLAYFKKASRGVPQIRDAAKRISDFEEITQTLASDTAASEADRCFRCGRCTTCGICYFFCPDFAVHRDVKSSTIVFDSEYCKGCCICVEECPRGVLTAEVKR